MILMLERLQLIAAYSGICIICRYKIQKILFYANYLFPENLFK